MGLLQSKDTPFGPDTGLESDITAVLIELESKYSTKQLTGQQCTKKVKQLAQQQAKQLGNNDTEICRKLMEEYVEKLKLIERIKSTMRYAERRFIALTKGPRCVNESPDVTDTMDVPSADLTEEQCTKIREDQLINYVWREEVYVPDRADQLANKGWYDIINRAYTDINNAFNKILELLKNEDIDIRKIESLLDIIEKNADSAYVEAVKYVYTQYKVARAESVQKMSEGAKTTQKGGGKKVKTMDRVKPCRGLKKH